jgi:Secretion system C-terminal sorting domain
MRPTRLKSILSLAIFVCLSHIQQAQLLNNYTNSWLGNTFGTPNKHILHSIDNMYVTPSGKVAAITSWDEGGHNVMVFDSNGEQIGVPEGSGTGGWGKFSGSAVFINDEYIYQIITQTGCDGNDGDPNHYPGCGTDWHCIRRYEINGSPAPFVNGKGFDESFLVVSTDTLGLNGVVVFNNELYVSDKYSNTIKVYNATSMDSTVVRTLAIGYSGLLDYDSEGNLWVLDIEQQKVVRFSPMGALQEQQIVWTENIVGTSFCVDKFNDRILLSNNGVDQNILVYNFIFSNPVLSSTIGTTGGIHANIMGEVMPLKFSEPKGVGVDSLGNVFVGNNGVWQGGARIEKYNVSNEMEWRLNGLIFTDNGSVDPESETDFYTKEFHLTLNLNNSIPGTEWSLKGMTINRFAFPQDDRISASDNTFWTTTYTRNISGKKVVYISDMYGRSLAIYKFNPDLYGEIAIPSVLIDGYDDTEIEYIWTDQNNDQLHQTNEYDDTALLNPYLTHVVPDLEGNIWKTYRENGIRFMPLQGFDANGNPDYSYSTSLLFANPSGIHDVKRIEYDTETGALYVAGRSSTEVSDNWGCSGDVLARYDNYLSMPEALPVWSITTPFYQEESINADSNIKAFCTAGDYIFTILTKEGKILVREKSTGNLVGEISPDISTDFTSGWSDFNGAVQAHKRANGEYLIFAEENGFGKIMMYRWCPTANCTGTGDIESYTEEKIEIYPNPTSNFVRIEGKGAEKVELYNILGELILSRQRMGGVLQIDMQNLPNGFYILKTNFRSYPIIKQ